MLQFSVGKANVTRIEETYLAVYDPKELFPEFTDEIYKEHAHWLAPALKAAIRGFLGRSTVGRDHSL